MSQCVKPEGDRNSLSIIGNGIKIESPTQEEESQLTEQEEQDNALEPDKLKKIVNNASYTYLKLFWLDWRNRILNHIDKHKTFFNLSKAIGNGAHLVNKSEFGRNDRPVLQMSEQARNQVTRVGKAISVQYISRTEIDPIDIVDEIPYNICTYDVQRIREFMDTHERAWVQFDSQNWKERIPISADGSTKGIIYMFYCMEDGEIVPRYIGVSKKDSRHKEGLSWAFKNCERESVLTRFGYGKGQHVGELSASIWPEEYSRDSEPRYDNWVDNLFHQSSRILK